MKEKKDNRKMAILTQEIICEEPLSNYQCIQNLENHTFSRNPAMQIGKQVPGPLHRIYRTKHNEKW
jgi:hypothetical protein